MSKILIFGLPRTATTVFQQQISELFAVKNLNEPYSNNRENWIQWSEKQQNCVVKLLTTNLYQFGEPTVKLHELVKEGKFTDIIVTQRKNLTDCCASLFYAERVLKKYHFSEHESVNRVRFSIDNEFLDSWLSGVKLYYQYINDLRVNGVSYEIFDYDLYTNGISQKIFNREISANGHSPYYRKEIKYHRLCVNYQEVTTTIKNYVKRIQR